MNESLYGRLGVPVIVNAKGAATRLSGGVLHPEVTAAMAEASAACVDMIDLHAVAAAEIAAATGAENGLATSGAAASLLLAAAACMAGLDLAAMARLPDARGLKREIVAIRSQRNDYDHALRGAGARLVEVGLPDRFAGAGIRDAEPWELEAAIGPNTAAVLWVASARARPPLEEVVAVAHRHDVPVIVDAAAELPPAAKLRTFIAAGADLVAFSGGKGLGGPQASGILCGRRDLVMSAALQMLDLDLRWGDFDPPPSFIDKALLPGLPRNGVGRPCKADKGAIAGLLTALRRFLAESDEARTARWQAPLDHIREELPDLPFTPVRGGIPRLALQLADFEAADRLYRALLAHRPVIHLDHSEMEAGRLYIAPNCLAEGDAERIVEALRILWPREARR